MATQNLNPERIGAIIRAAAGGTDFQGVVHTYRLDPSAVAQHRAEIVSMLAELPEPFFDNGGGGWSFLNLCTDRHDRLWTGDHSACEQLIVLAEALGLATYPMARDMWDILPGGMPYVMFKRSKFAKAGDHV